MSPLPAQAALCGLLSLATLAALAESEVPTKPVTNVPAATGTTSATATAQQVERANRPDDAITLPSVIVRGERYPERSFNQDAAATVGKSDLPLSETPVSATVIGRDQLDSQQAQSLADALHNVAGVVSDQYGRRGWDDLIIRGQVASDSLYLDGLRTAANNRVAEQLFGLQQIEVLKGPASLLYGLVLPGGLVNMVSKRPESRSFTSTSLTLGTAGLVQGTVDLGRPLSDNGKAAWRLNALAMDADDATDHVWFRNRSIAPSLSLDLGPNTEFTLLTSYQQRDYLRQQGLPLSGSVVANPNGQLPSTLFTGEPGQKPYHGTEGRVGYVLSQHLADGWTLRHALRWQTFELDGQLVANGSMSADNQTLRRTATDQHWDGRTLTQDTHLQRSFDTAHGRHEITLGLDYLDTHENTRSTTCTVGNLKVYAPAYGSVVVCPATPRTATDTTVRSTGLYVRDQMAFGDGWRVVAGLRRDQARSDTINRLTGARTVNPSSANTGSLAVMLDWSPSVRPYLSYASSFYPNSGVDARGEAFRPETGRQWEAGVKFGRAESRSQLTVAAFDLRRRQVLQDDPANDGYSIAVGEQRTRGLEVSAAMDLDPRLSLMAGYAYSEALVTDDGGQTATTVGDWLINVPRHSFSASARYRLDALAAGWELNAGIRGESRRHNYDHELPGYAVADVGLAYTQQRWRLAMTVKNLLDQTYYSGGVRAAVAVGDGRSGLLSVGYRY